jgi:hypothetical protein
VGTSNDDDRTRPLFTCHVPDSFFLFLISEAVAPPKEGSPRPFLPAHLERMSLHSHIWPSSSSAPPRYDPSTRYYNTSPVTRFIRTLPFFSLAAYYYLTQGVSSNPISDRGSTFLTTRSRVLRASLSLPPSCPSLKYNFLVLQSPSPSLGFPS